MRFGATMIRKDYFAAPLRLIYPVACRTAPSIPNDAIREVGHEANEHTVDRIDNDKGYKPGNVPGHFCGEGRS